jgi:hypothetical protein
VGSEESGSGAGVDEVGASEIVEAGDKRSEVNGARRTHAAG